MAVVFTNEQSNNPFKTSNLLPEPIRGSIFLLLTRIFFIMVGTDTIYLSIRIFVFKLNPPFLNGTTTDIIFFIFLTCSYIVQIFLIYSVLLHWLNKRYYFENNHLIVKKGIFKITERIYDLPNLKSVIVTQSLLGNLLHIGTITLTIAAPGITEEVSLTEIPHPHILERQIKKFI